jgi:lipooligosaccharide transport system permease protein
MAATTAVRPRAATAVPPLMAGRVLGYFLVAYRRTWRGSAFSGFLSPLLYLGSLGFGLGALVDAGTRGGVGGVRYALFVAPGVLVATAMQTAIGESTYPVMGAIVWQRIYFGMLATPLRVIDVLLGHLSFIALRLALVSSSFAVVGVLLGAFRSWWILAAVPIAVLTGVAHAGPVMAYAARIETDAGFAVVFRLVMVPMFLFAGTFFPVEQLPVFIRPVAWVTPLWHGTESVRSLVLGTADLWGVLGHLGYLTVWAIGGVWLATGQYRRRLTR